VGIGLPLIPGPGKCRHQQRHFQRFSKVERIGICGKPLCPSPVEIDIVGGCAGVVCLDQHVDRARVFNVSRDMQEEWIVESLGGVGRNLHEHSIVQHKSLLAADHDGWIAIRLLGFVYFSTWCNDLAFLDHKELPVIVLPRVCPGIADLQRQKIFARNGNIVFR